MMPVKMNLRHVQRQPVKTDVSGMPFEHALAVRAVAVLTMAN
jgi:hypothetical protein